MLISAYILSFSGMIVLPILLWVYFARRFALSWRLVLAGALTFVASQVLHLPLVFAIDSFLQSASLIVSAIVLGLLAGIFEETARYILFRYILRKVRSWKAGFLVGLGHGGIEALLLGVLAALGFFTMLGLRAADLSTIPSIPADQLELARQQVEQYWSTPWYLAPIGFIERIFAMCLHVSLSLMVLYAVVYRKPLWFWLALLWHALVDAVAVYAVQHISILAVEGIIAAFAIASAWIIVYMQGRFSEDLENASTPILESGSGTIRLSEPGE